MSLVSKGEVGVEGISVRQNEVSEFTIDRGGLQFETSHDLQTVGTHKFIGTLGIELDGATATDAAGRSLKLEHIDANIASFEALRDEVSGSIGVDFIEVMHRRIEVEEPSIIDLFLGAMETGATYLIGLTDSASFDIAADIAGLGFEVPSADRSETYRGSFATGTLKASDVVASFEHSILETVLSLDGNLTKGEVTWGSDATKVAHRFATAQLSSRRIAVRSDALETDIAFDSKLQLNDVVSAEGLSLIHI